MGHLHSVYDSDMHFSINPTTRKIRNESSKNSLVQFDHNSERFTFEIPRFVEEHDMSLCDKIEVHFINIGNNRERNEDVYDVSDLQLSRDDEGVAIFSWLVSGNATQFAGSLSFLIRFVCLSEGNIEYAWHTEIFSGIKILNGMNNGEAIITEYSDILEQWKRELEATGGISDDKLKAVVEEYFTENPVQPELDDTLTREGVAADSKAVGDKVISYISAEQVEDAGTILEGNSTHIKIILKDGTIYECVLPNTGIKETLTLEQAPNSGTVGYTGQLAFDKNTNRLYVCTYGLAGSLSYVSQYAWGQVKGYRFESRAPTESDIEAYGEMWVDMSEVAIYMSLGRTVGDAGYVGVWKKISGKVTDADKQEIAEQAAALVDTALLTIIGTGVIE